MRTAKQIEAREKKIYAQKQAALKKLEKEAARVATQQAVAGQNWQQIAEEAAKVRHIRQEAVAQRQATKAQQAEALEVTRAVSKAKAAAARRAPVEAPAMKVCTLAPV